MSVRRFIIPTGDYSEISDTDCIVVNESSYGVRIIFSSERPNENDPNFVLLSPEEEIVKENNFPEGKLYARCDEPVNQFNRLSVLKVMFGSAGEGDSSQEIIRATLQNILEELQNLTETIKEVIDPR